LSFIKLDKQLYRKNFYTIAIDSISTTQFGAIVDLRDEGGNHICQLHLFKSEEEAGQEARAYWEEYIHGDREMATELLGVDTLLSWAYGELGGPGSVKVKNLEEWLDLYLETPDEHFESGPYDIELIGENIVEELGFKPTIAYSMD
jgi:hypothetical protein